MANRKISEFTALTQPAPADVLPIVDVSEALDADKNKKITVEEIFKSIPSGTAASPGIAFESDDGNGIYFASPDTIGISTSGTSRLTISSGGTVAIAGGLTTGGTIVTTGSESAAAFIPTGSGVPTNGLYLPSANNVAISTNGTGRLFVDASGNVGIGATATAPLDVYRTTNAELRLTTSADGYLQIGQFTNGGFIGTSSSDSVDGALRFGTAATERMRLTSTGLLGLGTSSPGSLLHLSSNSTSSTSLQIENTSTGGTLWGLHSVGSAAGLGPVGSLVLRDSTIGATRVVVDTSGRVGLGTTSPSVNLEVVGTTADPVFAGVTATNASSYSALQVRNTGTSGRSYHIGVGGSSAASFANSFYIYDATASAGRLVIDSSGNVGVGTASPNQPLEVNGTIRGGSYQFSDSGTSVASYIGFSNSNGPTAEFWGSASANSGSLLIKTAGTERARIDSSGRLLVGTSNSTDNTRLNQKLAIVSTGTDNYAGMGIVNYGGTTAAAAPFIDLKRSRGTTDGSYTEVAADDALGYLVFQGADGAGWSEGAAITAFADGDWTTSGDTTDSPSRLVFSTTADGASSPTERLRIQESGDLRIANATTFYPSVDNAISIGVDVLRFSAVFAANGTIQTSDEREKTEVAEAILGSDFVKSLRPVSYKWIEGGKRDTGERDESNNYIYESVPGQRTHWGFIAQEVKEAVDAAGVDFGGWVLTDKDDPGSQQALRYDQFIAPLTKALQEALAKIETLEAKVAALEAS
jgi:hypothetical protein